MKDFAKNIMKSFLKWLWDDITAKVRFEYQPQETRELRKVDDYDTNNDFESEKDFKQTIKNYLRNYMCPRCNSHKVSGQGIIVRYGQVKFFKEVPYKGIFGGTKYRDECYKTLWRIYEIGLRPGIKSGIIASGADPGRIKCNSKGCGWEIVAPIYKKKATITWYSANDIINTGKDIKESVKYSLEERSRHKSKGLFGKILD